MASVLNSASLPTTMEDKLRSIRRRLVVLAAARAVAFGVAALIGAMVVAMALDWWLTLFSTPVRVALTSASLIFGAGALLAAGARPLIEALKFARAAADADGEVPQLEERWTTVASFAVSEHQPTSATARAMLQQVTSEAVTLGRLVRPAQVAKPAALKPGMVALAGSGVLLLTFLTLNWAQTSVLLRRFWAPTQNITATQLASQTGDREVPRGELLELMVAQAGVQHEAALLEVEGRDGILDVFEMGADAEQGGAFAYELPVDNSFRYRVSAGDGQTPWHRVTAIDYPELAEVRLTVTPPEYVDRPPYEKTVIPSRVKVVQGSQLELLMKPVESLERLELQLIEHVRGPGGEDQSTESLLVLEPQADGWYRYSTQLIEDLSVSPTLLNSHGLKNEDKRVCRFQVVADKAPVARIVSPTDEMAVAVDDVLDIKFEAHDDFGIATAELVIYDESAQDENGEPKILAVKEIELGDQQLARHVMGNTQLDLKELGLKEGTNISYAIRVSDNRDLQLDPEAMAARRALAKAEQGQEAGSLDGDSEADDRKSDGRLLADANDARLIPRNGDELSEKMLADAADRDGETSDRAGSEKSSEDGKGNSASDGETSRKDDTGDGKSPATVASTESDGKPRSDSDAGSEQKNAVAQTVSASPAGKKADGTNRAKSDEGSSPKAGDAGESRKQAAVAVAKRGDETASEGSEAAKGGADGKGDATSEPGKVVASDAKAGSKGEGGDTKDREFASADPSSDEPGMPSDASTEKAAGSEKSDGAQTSADGKAARGSPTSEDKDATGDSQSAKPDAGSDSDSQGNSGKSGDQNPRGEERDRQRNDSSQSSTDDEAMPDDEKRNSSNSGGNGQSDGSSRPAEGAEEGVPRQQLVGLNPQKATSAQNSETGRRRLRITERLLAIAEAAAGRSENLQIRDRVVEIDRMLKLVETALTRVVDRNIPDADRAEQFRRLDTQLGDIESYIGELRDETKEQQFAFVGLQMVHIVTTHVTPARDRVFAAIREPLGTDNPKVALHHIARAREMLDALLKRYDRVARERALADAIDESVEMYEVYVEKMQTLMREARQNLNPLQRKMGVIEVDQEYLDRYAEVETLRREMMTEFGRMLGDDPRLLARYLDILRRRRKSLRDQLTELAQRQDEVATELSGWLQVGEAQRPDLWTIVAEMRLHAATPLAKEADGLLERVQQSLPLILKEDEGTAALALQQADKVARAAREITFDARKVLESGGTDETPNLTANAEKLVILFGELDAALDQLNFENEGEAEVMDYVSRRLIESRTVADQADAWAEVAEQLDAKRYSGLARIDQQTLAIATELLRIEMLSIEDDLEGQFQQVAETDVPGEIVDMIRDLHRVMEAITFNQNAASFALAQDRQEVAEVQQMKALDNFDRAEKLFDLIRRAVVAELDQYDVDNPNIADLQDPTLDRFLAQLEREPNIQALLGIPNRPRNLRILSDSMLFQQDGGGFLGSSGEAARQRARQAMQMQLAKEGRKPGEEATQTQKPDSELTDEERQERERAKQLQETLEKSLASVQEKLEDPETTPEQRQRLEQMAQNMRRMLDQNSSQHNAAQEWERIVESDQAKETLRALAAGQRLPDSQWNKLLSTLDDGLWQVRGRTPPEDYRKAIEQYQERLRKLLGAAGGGAE
ncbi:hypothetical protein GC176_06230 [bacterium]|nr:hypothetical protein [bacterium]